MDNQKCDYCGEDEAVKTIFSPNADGTMWKVCLGCEAIIPAQQKMVLGHIIRDDNPEFGQKIIDEANSELDALVKETGKEILSVKISKKDFRDEK